MEIRAMQHADDKKHLDSLLTDSRWIDDLVRRIVGHNQELGDIAQEVRLAALDQQQDVRQPRAWLARVIRNTKARFLRRRKRRRGAEKLAWRPLATPTPSEHSSTPHDVHRLV